MGIQGLLPLLKPVMKTVNLRDFKGATVAIDAYCWLHKGAFACAEKLAMGEKTDQYVFYCLKYVNALLAWGIKPVLVFDGCHLPSKKDVEKSRRERRDAYRKKAAQFLREGKRGEARQCLERCVDITPEMALELMLACRNKGVDCIVAPYEADAQLAFLSKTGVAQIIVTEDSDLVLFGCTKVVYKLDMAGNGLMIDSADLNEVAGLGNDGYTFERFRRMCILSGCDYLPSLRGIGLGTAKKILKSARNPDITMVLKRLSNYMKNAPEVPKDYIEGFVKAENTFLYQLVFDPSKRKLCPLNPYPDNVDPCDMEYAGPYMSDEHALEIALGNINIYNGQRLASFDPDTFKPKAQSWQQSKTEYLHQLSIWDRNYRPKSKFDSTPKITPNIPSTAGKELQIKTVRVNNLRKSPKRKREESENGGELDFASVYGESTKKRKLEMDKQINKNQFEQSHEDNSNASTKTEYTHETKKIGVQTSRLNISEALNGSEKEEILRYENSIQTNHAQDNLNQTGSYQSEPVEDTLSPSKKRNVFATKLQKKAKFNINASKPKTEVKSRFFVNKSPKIKQTAIDQVMDLKKTDSKVQDITERTDQNLQDHLEQKICDSNSSLEKSGKTMTETNSLSNSQKEESSQSEKNSKTSALKKNFSNSKSLKKSNKSPSSSFDWSKFQSNSSKKETVSLKSSETVSSQFKPLIQPGAENTADDDDDDVSDLSQLSRCYSIDTMSYTLSQPAEGSVSFSQDSLSQMDSQEDSGSEKDDLSGDLTSEGRNAKLVNPENSVNNVPELVDLCEDSSERVSQTATTSQKVQSCRSIGLSGSYAATPKSTGKSSLLGQARRSGLSKKSSKKAKQNNENNQQTISSFFSKFQHKKKESLPKLQPQEKPKSLSPRKMNILDTTPETDVIMVYDTSKVQRKIL